MFDGTRSIQSEGKTSFQSNFAVHGVAKLLIFYFVPGSAGVGGPLYPKNH